MFALNNFSFCVCKSWCNVRQLMFNATTCRLQVILCNRDVHLRRNKESRKHWHREVNSRWATTAGIKDITATIGCFLRTYCMLSVTERNEPSREARPKPVIVLRHQLRSLRKQLRALTRITTFLLETMIRIFFCAFTCIMLKLSHAVHIAFNCLCSTCESNFDPLLWCTCTFHLYLEIFALSIMLLITLNIVCLLALRLWLFHYCLLSGDSSTILTENKSSLISHLLWPLDFNFCNWVVFFF